MSPEPAKGRAADKRSDVWAFGCVLYEMLTGVTAFPGEDVLDTLTAVMRSEPDWSALPARTPAHVRTLLERCLKKNRKERIADIAVAQFPLDAGSTKVSGEARTPRSVAARALPWPRATQVPTAGSSSDSKNRMWSKPTQMCHTPSAA